MNEIICGDALTVLREMPCDSVNTCITSPPYYGLRDYGCDGQIGLEETPVQYISRLTEIFREVRRVLKPDGVCWINIGDSYAGSGKGAWDNDKLNQHKNKQSYKYSNDNPAARMKRGVSANHKYINGASGQTAHNINLPRENRSGEDIEMPTMRNKRDVWIISTNSYRDAHFATFPVELVRPCILSGCPADGVVLDPFIGSGTTAVTAIMEGRNYIGIDLNPEYCALARERIAKQIALA